jgi:multidrug resistance efflux pump
VVPPPDPLVRRWRPPLRAGVYVVLGLMLTAWLGSALYRRVWRIEVDAASIIATTARVASPADGVVGALRVDEGAVVRTGDVLFEVEAAGVESALERVAIEVEEARAAVARREAERVAAVERLRIEGGMARTRAGADRRQAELLSERVGWAEAQVARLEALAAAPGISPFEVEAARGAHAALSGQLAATRARLAVESARIRAGARGYAFDGERVAPALPELDAALAEAQTELALAERRHTAERVRAEGLRRARAPFPGRVAALAQPAGAAVRQGTVVVVLEADTERRVEAPEGVAVALRVAGPFPRLGAWLIDQGIRLSVYSTIGGVLGLLGSFGEGIMSILIFVVEWFYPVVFELRTGGRTPGKMAIGLMVVQADGTPITPGAALLRMMLCPRVCGGACNRASASRTTPESVVVQNGGIDARR